MEGERMENQTQEKQYPKPQNELIAIQSNTQSTKALNHTEAGAETGNTSCLGAYSLAN